MQEDTQTKRWTNRYSWRGVGVVQIPPPKKISCRVEFEKNIIKLGYMEYTEIYKKIPAHFLHHKKSSTKLRT
jgi:hypothetical protein